MKLLFLFSLIFAFQLLYCVELSGIKFEVNEEMARAVLLHFYSDINNEIKDMAIDDIHVAKGVNIRDIKAGIKNFTPDKVKFTFRESGINIKITGLQAHLFVRAYISNVIIPFTKHADVDINSFSLEANIRVTSKYVDGNLVPSAEFIETPKHDIDLDVNIGGFLFLLNGVAESIAKKEIKKALNNFIENKSGSFLQLALEKIKTEMCIDETKGYCLDYSLVTPIKMKNGYLEVNSYALLYNQYKPKTQKKNRIPLSYIPPISKVGKKYQLYISEYSINAALFTLFNTEKLSFELNSNTVTPILLALILPGINEKTGKETLKLYFEITQESSLEFNERDISAKIYGLMNVKNENSGEIIFQANLELSTSVTIVVKGEKTITGNVNSFGIKVGSIPINKYSSEVLIEQNINSIIPLILPFINDYITKNIRFTLPVFFKNIDIQHKTDYLTVNYELKQEIFTAPGNSVLSSLERIFLEKDTYTIKSSLSSICTGIKNFFEQFFPGNTNILNQITKVNNAIMKIADNLSNEKTVRTALSELEKELNGINSYFKYITIDFSPLMSSISMFAVQNANMANNIPPEGIQSVGEQLKRQLREWAVYITCRVSEVNLQIINNETDYFIFKEYDYYQCINSYRP